MLANKQDVEGAMTAMEISQSLKLHALKQQSWQIQACSAVTGAAAKADKCHRVHMAPTPPYPARAVRRAGPAASAPQALPPQCRSVASTAWRLKAPPPSRPQPLSRLPAPIHTVCATQVKGFTKEWTGWLTPCAPSDDAPPSPFSRPDTRFLLFI